MSLYHGSPYFIEVGEIIKSGIEINQGDSHEEVYSTNDIDLAYQYALEDGYIYEVEPIDIIDNDVFGYGENTIISSKLALVIRILY